MMRRCGEYARKKSEKFLTKWQIISICKRKETDFTAEARGNAEKNTLVPRFSAPLR